MLPRLNKYTSAEATKRDSLVERTCIGSRKLKLPVDEIDSAVSAIEDFNKTVSVSCSSSAAATIYLADNNLICSGWRRSGRRRATWSRRLRWCRGAAWA